MAAKKSAIDIGLIRELAAMINETDVNEVEVEEGELRIRLARGGAPTVSAPAMQAPAPHVHQTAPQASVAAAPAPAAAAAEQPAAPTSGSSISSPMVGTAYLSPSPDADPFVSVGDSVKKGQTIMIVEAMKTMNQIPASEDGVVASIAVEDGQPVEFGQTLIVLQ